MMLFIPLQNWLSIPIHPNLTMMIRIINHQFSRLRLYLINFLIHLYIYLDPPLHSGDSPTSSHFSHSSTVFVFIDNAWILCFSFSYHKFSKVHHSMQRRLIGVFGLGGDLWIIRWLWWFWNGFRYFWGLSVCGFRWRFADGLVWICFIIVVWGDCEQHNTNTL